MGCCDAAISWWEVKFMTIEIIKGSDGTDVLIDHDEVNNLAKRPQLETRNLHRSVQIRPEMSEVKGPDDGDMLD